MTVEMYGPAYADPKLNAAIAHVLKMHGFESPITVWEIQHAIHCEGYQIVRDGVVVQ